MTIELILADPHPVMLEGLERVFHEASGFVIRSMVNDGQSAWQDVQRLQPHVIVHELELAGKDGPSLIRAVDELAYVSGYEYAADLFAMARDYGQKILDQALQQAKAAGVDADIKLIDLPAQRLGETVATEAREWQADLIVVGTHGRKGIGRVFLGSGAEQIIRLAPVPILVVRGEQGGSGSGF